MTNWFRLITLIVCRCCLLLIPVCFVQATETEQKLETEARKTGSSTLWSGDSTEEFHRNCPGFLEPIAERGVRGGFTQQCEAILDQVFLNQMLPWTPIHAKDNTLTWRYVLHKPLRKREIVLNTLRDPVCSVSGNLPSGDELVDRCNANVIADYAALKYGCAGGLPSVYEFIEEGFEVPSYLSVFDRIFDNDSYWEKRWRLEYGFFRYAWIAAKCASVPREAFASLGVFENTMEFGGSPVPGEEDWWWAEQGFEAYQLMGVADKLSTNLVQIEYRYERKNLSSWQLVEPVMAELVKIKDPGDFRSYPEEKAARLKHFIAASTWIKMRNVDVDQNWLRGQIGEFSDEELTQAAEEAKTMMSKQGVGETWF